MNFTILALLHFVCFLPSIIVVRGQVSCPDIRYARIDSGGNYLQISELAVYNTSGVNVARGKNTSAGYKCASTSGPVDGVLQAKDFSVCKSNYYHSYDISEDFWQVDLGSSHTISKVVYYNRNAYCDRATTYTLTLLNADGGLVCSCSTFTSDLIQDLALIAAPTTSPTVMPTTVPSSLPTTSPSSTPTLSPSASPSTTPTAPSVTPTTVPSSLPTASPSSTPTDSPSTIPSAIPTTVPSFLPSASPSSTPTVSPSTIPSTIPTTVPSSLPTTSPSSTPTVSPSTIPSAIPTTDPSSLPTASPSLTPTLSPSASPSTTPTAPSAIPTTVPSSLPTASPSSTPTDIPSTIPSTIPTTVPSSLPTASPSSTPTVSPSTIPSDVPTTVPSSLPTASPSSTPTVSPSTIPSAIPTTVPSSLPTASPSSTPTVSPSTIPSAIPTTDPSSLPTNSPSSTPTVSPSTIPSTTPTAPSAIPTTVPSSLPTASPSSTPTVSPSTIPSTIPSTVPSSLPTASPSSTPTVSPSTIPSAIPTTVPSSLPTASPSSTPTVSLSTIPSAIPTTDPSSLPTASPSSTPTLSPSTIPSAIPTTDPSFLPTASPSSTPTVSPSTIPSAIPTTVPSSLPTASPSSTPTVSPSTIPSAIPTTDPSSLPTASPSSTPTLSPSTIPSDVPTTVPSSLPTASPSSTPTVSPSASPTNVPSTEPTSEPTLHPTFVPSSVPTLSPTTSAPTRVSCPDIRYARIDSGANYLQISQLAVYNTSGVNVARGKNTSAGYTCASTSGPVDGVLQAKDFSVCSNHFYLSYDSFGDFWQVDLGSSHTISKVVYYNRNAYCDRATTYNLTLLNADGALICICSTFTSNMIQDLTLAYVPTTSPTVMPSSFPTSSPSATPSTVPSSLPTSFPTLSPTSNPTKRPTVTPTRTPTFKPSMQPVTALPTTAPVLPPTTSPTTRGATNPPSASPSSAPSWNLVDYKSKPIYRYEYHPLVNRTETTVDTRKVFSSFTYKGYVKEGGCADWKSFASTSLNLPVSSYYFSDVTATFGFENFHAAKHTNVTATCSGRTIVSGIVTTIKSKTITSTYPDYAASCSGYLWRVFTCNGAPVLCVNCSGDCSCPGLSTTLTSSCDSSSSCLADTASYSDLIFNIKQRVLYPKLTILNILVDRTDIEIAANISNAGSLYCLAVTSNTTLLSVYQVKQYGSSSVVFDSTKNTTLTLSGLSPSTDYTVYCYTEDSVGNGMDLSTVKATGRGATTSCCPSIAFTSTYSSIIEYSSNFTAADASVFTFTLEKTPSSTQTVKLELSNAVCSNGIAYSTSTSGSVATAFPSTFVFASGSLVLSGSFVVHGSPGCYEITASGTGLRNATVSLSIYNTSTVVTPAIKSAYFSSDGSSVYIFFDSSTNYGKTKIVKYASGFPCSELLLFTGSTSFICKWLSNKLIFAYLAIKITDAPSIGDPVQLISGVLSPSCVRKVCTAAAAASGVTVTLSTPLSPIDPTASLSAPALISSCGDIILDPTASSGQGLRDWSSVQWYVSSSDFDTSLIATFLNTYHNSTTETITVPNSYLTVGSVTFALYLTNFLGLSSFTTATVEVSSSSDIPYTTISGSSVISIYRWQTLSLFSYATVSSCDQTSANTSTATRSSALSYSWKVYQGLTYQSSLSSSSLNPRYFKLPAYSLDTLSQYTVQVTTTSVSTGSFSSASVSVYIKQSGILATISGGAKRVVSTFTPLVLNASTSYDKDTGSGDALTYSWSCFVVAPVYGAPCGLTLSSTTSAITIPAFTLSAKTYNFTVVAASTAGTTGSISVIIVALNEELASISFSDVKSKYNPEDRLIFSSSVTAVDSLKAVWSCPSCGLNLSDIALTPLTLYFGKGTTVIGISLSSSSFVSGLSYSLQLSCSYYNRSQHVTSYSQATIIMNAPPVQGLLTVAPATGTAMATSFYLNTYGWLDDASDYPISYAMTYYTKDTSTSSLIKSIGTIQYAYAYIGQGLSVSNFTVTCVATASDIYGCSGSADRGIRVLPPASAASLQSSLTQQLSLASETSNPDLTIQTSGATTSYLNAASCASAPDCASLNRSDCDTVTNTCGPCLSGYLGVSGYANSGCRLPASLQVTGGVCSSNSDCVSNNCQSNHLCAGALKTCSNNCSGSGVCQYYDANSDRIASCDANSDFCKAKCSCYNSRFGSDCSLSLSDYQQRLSMRERMCVSLYAILDIQDVTSDVITGRATLLSSLLLDVTQLTDNALSNCTLALTTTVQQYPSLCVGDSVYDNVITALSSVTENGKSLSLTLSAQVSTAIDTLLVNRQLTLATNEESSVVTDNLRMYSTVAYKSDLGNQLYPLPQSDLEAFTQLVPAQVQIASTATDPSAMVRVSLSQCNINYRNATTDASIVKLQVYYDSTTATTTAKLIMQNNQKMTYASSASYNTTVYCTTASTSYNKSANCSGDPSLVVLCPGTTTRIVTAVCPASQYLPQCLSWNGVKYYQDPSCQRVTYSPTNTSCECSGSTGYVSRRQLDAATDVNRMAGEFSASAMIEVQAFVSTWKSAADLSASSITDNYYIVLTVSLIAAFFILGFFNITCKSYFFPEKNEESKSESEAERLTLGNANAFFDSILPVEFKFRPWYSNFWIKLVECHPHLAYFAPARGRRLYHTKMWLGFCFEVLFFIFMDSIFSPLANADDSTCAVYVTEATCIQPVSFDLTSTVCVWDAEGEECLYNPPDSSFTVTIIVVLVASICSQPAAALAEYLIEKATARTEEEINIQENKEEEHEGGEADRIRNGSKLRLSNSSIIIPEGILSKESIKSADGRRGSNTGKIVPLEMFEGNVESRPVSRTSANTGCDTASDTHKIRGGRRREEFPMASLSNNLVVEDFDESSKVKVGVENGYDVDADVDKVRDEEKNNVLRTLNEKNRKFGESQDNDSQVVPDHVVNRHAQPFMHMIKDAVVVDGGNKERPLMTLPSLMMLAARLSLLQQRLDNSTPEEELEWLLKGSSEMYETDIIAEANTTITLLHTISGMKTTAAADQSTVEVDKVHSKLLHKITQVRRRAENVIGDLQEMETDEAKEKYLIKKFIVELKKGVYKKVIFRHFFELEEEEEEGDAVHWLVRAISIVALICLAFGCLFYILLTGISLGQTTTILWLEVLAIGIVQDVFLLKPLGIWFRFIAIASVVSDSVRHVTDLVHDRVHFIMRRTQGVVRHNSLLVQHFNAACRAARVFPHLQTSRLLIALNDYDLPKTLPNKRRLLKLFLDMFFLLFVLVILMLTLMPEVFQEVIIEASMTAFVNFPIYVLLLLANLSIALPVVVVVVIFLFILVREYVRYRKRQSGILKK